MHGVISYYIDEEHRETRIFNNTTERKEYMRQVLSLVGLNKQNRVTFIVRPLMKLSDYNNELKIIKDEEYYRVKKHIV